MPLQVQQASSISLLQKRFVEFGLMMTPGLVVDGELRVQGNVPSIDEIKTMLA